MLRPSPNHGTQRLPNDDDDDDDHGNVEYWLIRSSRLTQHNFIQFNSEFESKCKREKTQYA